MTALDLIDSIFTRTGRPCGVPNMRGISGEQLGYLRRLIERDPESAKVHAGNRGSLVWTPEGRDDYVLTEDPLGGDKHTLMRLPKIAAEQSGSLF